MYRMFFVSSSKRHTVVGGGGQKFDKNNLSNYFIKWAWSDHTKIINFIVKLLAVILYLIRAYFDNQDPKSLDYCDETAQLDIFPGFRHPNQTQSLNKTTEVVALFKVCRSKPLWIFQVILACFNFLYAIIIVILRSKGNFIRPLKRPQFWIEMITTLPFIVSLFAHIFKFNFGKIPYMQIWVPVFLNVWLADSTLTHILRANNDKENTALTNQIYDLIFTIFALLITCICGVSHFERCGPSAKDFNLLNSTWFVFVTLSTVGYGDISPETPYGKIVVIFVIICTVMILPSQLSELNDTRLAAKSSGDTYSRTRAKREKHVVISTTELRHSVIVDFLLEFYMYPKFHNYFVILLTPAELGGGLKRFLEIPIWKQRVIYMQGTVLDEDDLVRAKVNFAEGCFILTSRIAVDKKAEDEQTILRAMSIKDFAPTCPLYVQLLLPQSKLHVKFAEQVICDEEFVYQLLALNCDLPGISTALVLLSHTATQLKSLEDQNDVEQWKVDINKSIGSEIYDVVAGESKIYKAFVGESFTVAAYGGYLNSHTMLIGIKPKNQNKPRILLNPGTEVIVREEDTLYYIGDTRDNDLSKGRFLQLKEKSVLKKARMNARKSICSNDLDLEQMWKKPDQEENIKIDYQNFPWAKNCSKAFPPHIPHLSYHYSHMCYIVNEENRYSEGPDKFSHLKFENHEKSIRKTFNKTSPIIIICKEITRNILSLIIPMRSAKRKVEDINPIIIFTEKNDDDPSFYVLSAIACFPCVYHFSSGTLGSVTDLIRAGVPSAKCVILLKGNKRVELAGNSDHYRDQTQIIDYLNLELLFPEIRLILELTHLSNLRFLQFKHSRPLKSYEEADRLNILKTNRSKSGEHRREVFAVHTHMPYLFREAFCTGRAFSTSMLDTLLYQSFVKPYLPKLIQILLGLRYSDGSGNLAGIKIGRKQSGKMMKELMENDKQFFGALPFGIYREFNFETKHNRCFSIIPEESPPRNQINPENNISGNLSGIGDKLITDYKFDLSSEVDERESEQLRRVLIEKAHMLPTNRIKSLIGEKIEKFKIGEYKDGDTNPSDISLARRKPSKAGYVLLNPKPDKPVQHGDIVYVILPAKMESGLKLKMNDDIIINDVV